MKEKFKLLMFFLKKLNYFKLTNLLVYIISWLVRRKYAKLYVKLSLVGKYACFLIRTNIKYGDIYAIKEVIIDREYFKHKAIFKRRYRAILDIGAHIGTFSVYSYYIFKPKKLVALEPDKENIILLKMNLKLNKVKGIILLGAISFKNGIINFYIRNGRGPLRTTVINTDVVEIRKVPAYSLDTIIKKYIPDFIKMDCEGAEFVSVLSSKLVYIVKSIVMEYHLWAGQKYQLLNYLQDMGFKIIYEKDYGERGIIYAIK